MVVVRMNDTGKFLDTEGVKITYVKQTSDIGDISKANTSYSWGFKLPKTHYNSRQLQGLGMIGDLSQKPYEKQYVSIIDNGVEIVSQGLLKITETTDEYKAHVQDGIIEFYNEIKTDTIAEALDLSDIRHQSTINNMIASQTNPNYRYLVADYNYQKQDDLGGITNLMQLGMIPSVNMGYLWDKIFEHYGWTYSGSFKLNNSWMLYPSTKDIEVAEGIQVLFVEYPNQIIEDIQEAGWFDLPNGTPTINATHILQLSPTSWKSLSSGNFIIELIANGTYEYDTPEGHEIEPYSLVMFINGIKTPYRDSSWDPVSHTFNLILNVNDIVEFKVQGRDLDAYFAFIDVDVPTQIKLSISNVVTIDWEQAFIKYKIKDFFKEVMIRQSLTAFTDVLEKHIHFLTADERLNAEIIDWSSKYVERKGEKYVYDSYAQKNYYRHKYDEELSQYSDGILEVNNENLRVEKDLYVSKIYSPLEDLETFKDSAGDFFVRNYKMWNAETKLDKDDLPITEYKSIKNRFYVIETDQLIYQTIYIDTIPMNPYAPAQLNGGLFSTIIEEKYDLIRAIIDQSRIHNIELLLSKADMMALDLEKLYYFEQEKQVYLLNKIIWKEGKTVTGEFIRVNR